MTKIESRLRNEISLFNALNKEQLNSDFLYDRVSFGYGYIDQKAVLYFLTVSNCVSVYLKNNKPPEEIINLMKETQLFDILKTSAKSITEKVVSAQKKNQVIPEVPNFKLTTEKRESIGNSTLTLLVEIMKCQVNQIF